MVNGIEKLKFNKAPCPDTIIAELLKKGGKGFTDIKGITDIPTIEELVCFARATRLSVFVEKIVAEYQSGFRRGRSTTEQIFNIRQIMGKTREFGIVIRHIFIDFKTAYDSIDRKALVMAMRELKIPEKLMRLICLTLN